MPTAIIIDVMAVVLGGITGTVLRDKLSETLKEQMNNIFGLCAMCMGISTVADMTLGMVLMMPVSYHWVHTCCL